MKRFLLAAAPLASMAILSAAGPARPWGSVTAPDFNTHGCIGTYAHRRLKEDPAFKAANFPTIDQIEAHEGVNSSAEGPGADEDGATLYSEHYYNPRTGKGGAPDSVGKWFMRLAQKKSDAAQAAAWSAHFLADLSVIYHTNGEYTSELEAAFKDRPGLVTLPLPFEVTGDRELLSRPLAKVMPTHSTNFKQEADRFREAGKGKAYYDWFDPWYWNGLTASSLTSSHSIYEATVDKCPAEIDSFSPLWPGNPPPQFDQPVTVMHQTVAVFAKAVARSTAASTETFRNDPQRALEQATKSVYTMWRASYSGLKIGLNSQLEPAATGGGDTGAVFRVRGKLVNFAEETPTGVKVQLRVHKGDGCEVMAARGPEIQSVPGAAPGMHPAGDWRVKVTPGKACRVLIEAIGAYAKTPDLGYNASETSLKTGEVGGELQGRINFTEAHFTSMPVFFKLAPGAISAPATIALDVEGRQVTGRIQGKLECGPQIPAQAGARIFCLPFDGPIKGSVDASGAITATYSGVFHASSIGAQDVTQVGGVSGDVRGSTANGKLTIWFIENKTHQKSWPMSGTWSASPGG